MNRDFSVKMVSLDGKEELIENGKPLLAKQIVCNALLGSYEDEKLSGEDKVRRYLLAQKIYNSDSTVEVSSEDISLLKQLVAKLYTPLIVGQVYQLLEKD